MKYNEVDNGDIVIVDYITEFTKEHIVRGEAVVLWKCSLNHQPLIAYLDDLKQGIYDPVWTSYSHFSKKIGHINLSEVLKND